MTRSVPDLLLERYRLKELPDTVRDAIDRETAGNPALRARLDALDRSDSDIRAHYPPSTFVRRRPRRISVRGMVLAGAFAATVLAMVIALPHTPASRSETERVKGSVVPALAVYRWTSAGSERLADGDVAHPGDLLRLGYASAGRKYGLILSIDGKGAVTLHLPPSGDRAVPLGQDKLVLLDKAYELDDAPRIERFYFVTGERPFSASPIIAAAKSAGAAPAALPLPAGLNQVTFAIRKEAGR
jgi:hypothetical protein